MTRSASPPASQILREIGFSPPEGWDIIRIEDLLSEDRGISVGVMYPGEDDRQGIPLIRVSLVGDVGRCAVVLSEMAGWNAARAIAVVRFNRPADAAFLRYCLMSSPFQHLLRSWSTTTVQATLNLKEIRQIPVPWPPEERRDAIVYLLSAVDDKIELNRQMNETLEGMARALFKSWFVDFDPVRANAEGQNSGLPLQTAALFPNSFDMDLKPAGWHWEPLLMQARLISGGTPKTEVSGYWDGGIPWASAKDVSQCADLFLTMTERTISDRGLEESATRMVPKLSTVVVARGATSGRFRVFGRNMAMNQTCYALQSRNRRPFWLAAAFAGLIDELVHAAHGSVFDTITTSTLERARVIVGDDKVLNAFEETAAPLYHRVLINCEESRTLAALRDALLPKLISGELRVRNAERLVAEAAA